MKRTVFLLFIMLVLSPVAVAAQVDDPNAGGGRTAQILTITGPIGPATADFIRSGFETARDRQAALIILIMDTPGGLADSMRTIIHSVLGSPVPVIGYVFPSGSRAASAGTYILYACHIAAMAPGTNLGAATPIQIGGGGLPGGTKEPPADGEGEKPPAEKAPGNAMEAKMVNDAAAYIRSLAAMRGRNADWAEQSVRQGASLAVDEALEKNVIDLIAANVETLLEKIDGRQVTIDNQQVTLKTAGLETQTIEAGWRVRLLSVITNPNIAFILMLIGAYGLIFEFANPGSIGPGVVGVICLFLGFYALNVLPLNYAGLGLLFLGIVLMVAEAFVPSFGILGIGGIVAFVLAATMLFDTDVPGFSVSWPVIGAAAAVSGGLMIFLLGYVWKAQRRPVTTGREGLIGKKVEVLEWSGDSGFVRLGGERWKAVGPAGLAPHDRVEVRDQKGLVLIVQKTNQ